MSGRTGIQWTDDTWNPIRGCTRVSAGCQNCYAEAIAARFSGPGLAYEGLARRRSNGEPQWTGEVRVVEEHLYDPLRWKKPRRIFVNSMSDLFHEQLVIDDIAHIFAVMALASRHTFQVLTKRAQAMREVLSDPHWFDVLNAHIEEIAFAHTDPHNRRTNDLRATAPEIDDGMNWPLPNVWLGVSVEHQAAADERIPELLLTPAAVRFISAEPLLAPVDLSTFLDYEGYVDDQPTAALDWVIVGGESGRHARTCDIAWIRKIVDCCALYEKPAFVKQLGADPGFRLEDEERRGNLAPSFHHFDEASGLYIKKLRDSHGGDIAEWPEDLRVREFPGGRS